jgi:hypothetical protein
MSGRVLNFSEFSDKYNNDNTELSVDDISNAASNFEDGFDETTYDQPEIKPNRPVSGDYEMTPDSPGAESFSSFTSKEMDAPEDDTDVSTVPTEVVISKDSEESEEETEEDAEEEPTEGEEESEEETEEDDEKEEGNPEAGANPKKKVDESQYVKGFGQFVNENMDIEELVNLIKNHDGHDHHEDSEDTCPNCGELYQETEEGDITCGCNKEKECGCDEDYSCGCNM